MEKYLELEKEIRCKELTFKKEYFKLMKHNKEIEKRRLKLNPQQRKFLYTDFKKLSYEGKIKFISNLLRGAK